MQFLASNTTDKRRNVWRYTELTGANLTEESKYCWGSNLTRDNTKSVKYRGIHLTRYSGTHWYGKLDCNLDGYGINVFEPGAKYLASAYILGASPSERFFMKGRALASGTANGHGMSLLDNVVRRYFWLFTATDANDPDPVWFFSGDGTAWDFRIGGFMIEKVPSDTKHGVAVIGDSITAGSSGGYDSISSREWTRWAEGLMSVPFYNRAIGGQGTQAMIDRWATDMTPLAADCKYCIINAGLNDLTNLTSAQIQTNLTTLHGLAVTDGMIPIMSTITPTSNGSQQNQDNRTAVNAWIKTTFPLVMDFAAVLADPADPTKLRNSSDSGWYGDGVHFGAKGKRALGNYVAQWPNWDFVLPSPYQPVLATTPKLATFDDILRYREEPWVKPLAVWNADTSVVVNATLSPSS